VTTVLLNARRGSEQYQSMNSQMAWSHERFELADVRLFRTADLETFGAGRSCGLGVRVENWLTAEEGKKFLGAENADSSFIRRPPQPDSANSLTK
jgi:hypothetical protein